ncbi:uncharacterized protein LOC135484592 [Lineus longissimus]|uniref:uncharacterized protein LOC135484592 n=1 Tax=Lineus longissimus TaxID=88925 RepID=UPI002B4D72FD
MAKGRGQYKLELDTNKRNVFVTQLHQREDEEDDITAYPVVKESADRLIETGINTLQKTLLLKKEVEIEQVDVELQAKREEFRRRMEMCSERQIEIQKKQQKMKDRVAKFEKFIKENEAKRRRAIQKYHTEVKLKDQKSREYEMLVQQLEELKARHRLLQKKLQSYKKFELYLLKVVDSLPENYIEMNDNMVTGLMMRHRTLSDTNGQLVDNLLAMADEIERLRAQLEAYKQDHNKNKLSINSRLAQLQKHQETETENNKQLEQKGMSKKGHYREQRELLGMVLMAVDDLADKCHNGKAEKPLEGMDLNEKLDTIKEHLLDQEDVYIMSLPESQVPSEKASKKSSKVSQNNRIKVTFAR